MTRRNLFAKLTGYACAVFGIKRAAATLPHGETMWRFPKSVNWDRYSWYGPPAPYTVAQLDSSVTTFTASGQALYWKDGRLAPNPNV